MARCLPARPVGADTMEELLAGTDENERALRASTKRDGTDVAVGDRVVAAAEVVEANRGGLVVDLGLRGFAPLSQLASVGNLGGTERPAVPDALRDYVGKRLPLKVIEVDQRRDRLILSEKAAAQELRRRRKEEASSHLEEGQVLDGTVASVTPFGVFVDVGAADGLVHRSRSLGTRGSNPPLFIAPGTACVCSSPASTGTGVASPYLSSGWERSPASRRASRV
jgi:ribosomal protein S1